MRERWRRPATPDPRGEQFHLLDDLFDGALGLSGEYSYVLSCQRILARGSADRGHPGHRRENAFSLGSDRDD